MELPYRRLRIASKSLKDIALSSKTPIFSMHNNQATEGEKSGQNAIRAFS